MLSNKVNALDIELKEGIRQPMELITEDTKRGLLQVSSRVDILSDKFEELLRRENCRKTDEEIERRLLQLEGHQRGKEQQTRLEDETINILKQRVERFTAEVTQNQNAMEYLRERFDTLENRLRMQLETSRDDVCKIDQLRMRLEQDKTEMILRLDSHETEQKRREEQFYERNRLMETKIEWLVSDNEKRNDENVSNT